MATLEIYTQFMTNLATAQINLSADTLKLILVNGYSFDATDQQYSEVLASEIADGNGYTIGGEAMTGSTFGYSEAESRYEWDVDDVTVTATGGDIGPCTGAIIYSDSSVDDKLIGYIDFEGTKSASDGTDLRIAVNTTDGLLYID